MNGLGFPPCPSVHHLLPEWIIREGSFMKKKRNNPTSRQVGNPARFAAVMALLTAALLVGLILNITIGTVSISPGQVFSLLAQAMGRGLACLFTGGDAAQDIVNASTQSQILFSIRIPRLLLAMLLGGALSVSGYLLQVFFRNPIAGPFVLGISSGAKMVVGITLIFMTPFFGSISSLTLILAAFLGSLLVTTMVLFFSQKASNMSMLLVIGIMVGYICSAVTDFCITFADDHNVVNLTNWSMGTFSGASWNHVRTAACFCLPGLFLALLMSKPIGAYALGEGYAASMGVPIKTFRAALILLSSILSACVTALAGPISFVGIAVPQVCRTMLKSSKPAFMIPATFLCGGTFCVMCDLLARTLFAPTELSIGTITSFFGAPIVIYMMVKRRRGQEG